MKNILFILLFATFSAKAQSEFMVFDLPNGKKDTLYTSTDVAASVKDDEAAFYNAFLAKLSFVPRLRKFKKDVTVPLMFTVTKQGKIKDIDLVEPSSEKVYDEEVFEQANVFLPNQANFAPAKVKKRAVNAVYSIDVSFKHSKKISISSANIDLVINTSVDTIIAINLQNNKIYTKIVSKPDTINNKVYDVVDKQAEFSGGTAELMIYLRDNIKYPVSAREKGIQGRVITKFIVNEEGNIEDIKIIKSIHPLLDAESIRVIQNMPQWTPGKINNIPVKSYFTLPCSFKLEG
jgi:periplasmic protein TonB